MKAKTVVTNFRVKALRNKLRSWETLLRRSSVDKLFCAVELKKCLQMASTSEPGVSNSEATAIPSVLVPGTSVVAAVFRGRRSID